MAGQPINFFSEGISFVLKHKTLIRSWLIKCALSEKKNIESLNFIFCTDVYLKKINKQHLNHDYFTDIITFPNSETGSKIIGGDIFISIDRVRENATTYGVRMNEELKRVMAHGLMHLCGYGDKTEKEQKQMREAEESCLKKLD